MARNSFRLIVDCAQIVCIDGDMSAKKTIDRTHFQAYASIDHLVGTSLCKYEGVRFVATEKVHGANFSFMTDGVTIKRAKHSAVLAEDDDMYGNIAVAAAERDRLFKLRAVLAEEYKTTWVTVFGELFGGGYRDDKTGKVESIGVKKPVQKKPWYSKDVRFYAFDIYLPELGELVPYKKALAYFATFGFLYAKPLLTGTLRELLTAFSTADSSSANSSPAAEKAPPPTNPPPADGKAAPPPARPTPAEATPADSAGTNDDAAPGTGKAVGQPAPLAAGRPLLDAETKVASMPLESLVTWLPAELHLPPIKDNVVEGVVIRTLEGERIIFKVVTRHFRESIKSADPGKYAGLKPDNFKGVKFAELLAKTRADLNNYVVPMRWEHVLSKTGPLPDKTAKTYGAQRKRALGLYVADVLKAFTTDYPNVWEQYGDADQNDLLAYVNEHAATLLDDHN
jgi:hypothetical protein